MLINLRTSKIGDRFKVKCGCTIKMVNQPEYFYTPNLPSFIVIKRCKTKDCLFDFDYKGRWPIFWTYEIEGE